MDVYQWEKSILGEKVLPYQDYVFPAPDLLEILLDRYFTDLNPLIPLLHQPTFRRSVNGSLHHRDGGFARVLLFVCAVAARYVDDSRVLLPGASLHSAGWKWFVQVRNVRLPFVAPPTLYDVQAHCVSALLMALLYVVI
jgi:hypothetical protein